MSHLEIIHRIQPVLDKLDLHLRKNNTFRMDKGVVYAKMEPCGVIVKPHRNTFKRKRDTAWLVKFEYWLNDKLVFSHVEPFNRFPSDELIAKMTLLPREVNDAVKAC